MLGVFFDTLVLCTCTAIVILLAGKGYSGEAEGIRITQQAMTVHMGAAGAHFVSLAIVFFAFTSVVANFAYAESNLRVFRLDGKWGKSAYIIVYLVMVYWGSRADLGVVWVAADVALGMMTVVNVIAVILLSPTIIAVSRDYLQKLKNQPVDKISFKLSDCHIQGKIDDEEVWVGKIKTQD